MAKINFQNRSLFFVSQTGCLLPAAILFNLFFGLMFFKPVIWLCIEAVLILLFVMNSYIFSRKISSAHPKRGNVIDVEGEVVKEQKEPKRTQKNPKGIDFLLFYVSILSIVK